MADHDSSVSNRSFSFGFPGRKSEGDQGTVEGVNANNPQQYHVVTEPFLSRGNNEAVNAAFGSAVSLMKGSPDMDQGDSVSTGYVVPPWTTQSGLVLPVSVVADAVTNPSAFDLLVYKEATNVGGVELWEADPSDDKFGGSITGWFSRLDPDEATPGYWGACQMPHYSNYLSIPGWAGQAGQFAEGWISNIPIPTLSGSPSITVTIGITACRVPSRSDQNPKLGTYQYTTEEVVMGFKMKPQSVSVDAGTGELTFTIGNSKLLTANAIGAGTQLNHSGRSVLCYRKNPVATTGTAIQQTQIVFDSGSNTAVIAGGLGEGGSASTNADDYVVVVLGPFVTDTPVTDFQTNPCGGIAFLGRFEKDGSATNPWWTTASYVNCPGSSLPFKGMPSLAGYSNSARGFVREKPLSVAASTWPIVTPTTPALDRLYRIDIAQHTDEPSTDEAWSVTSATSGVVAHADFEGKVANVKSEIKEAIEEIGKANLDSFAGYETPRFGVPVRNPSSPFTPSGSTWRVLISELENHAFPGTTIRTYWSYGAWEGADSDYMATGTAQNQHGFEQTMNCAWNNTTGEWEPDKAAEDCFMFRMGRTGFMTASKDSGSPTNFADTAWDSWTNLNTIISGGNPHSQFWMPGGVIYTHLTSNNAGNPAATSDVPKNAIMSIGQVKSWGNLNIAISAGSGVGINIRDGLNIASAVTAGTLGVLVTLNKGVDNASAMCVVASCQNDDWEVKPIAINGTTFYLRVVDTSTKTAVDVDSLFQQAFITFQMTGRATNDGTNT